MNKLLFLASFITFIACDPGYRSRIYVENTSSVALNVEYQQGKAYDTKDYYEKKTVIVESRGKKLIIHEWTVGVLNCIPFVIKFLEVRDIENKVLSSQDPIDDSLWSCSESRGFFEIYCACTFTITEEMLTSPDDLPDSDSIDNADTLETPDNI